MPAILIVEDESKMRRLLELNLSEDGFTTFSAGDAETGLKMLRENAIDLVVTDLKLPGMDGLEFLQIVKRHSPALFASERVDGVDMTDRLAIRWHLEVLDENEALPRLPLLDGEVPVEPALVDGVGVEESGLRVEGSVRPVLAA